MNPSSRTLLSSLVILGGLWGTWVPVCAQDTERIDLQEITRRLEAWRGSFVNLRVVWELRSLPKTIEAPLPEWSVTPDLREEARLFLRVEWIWADHGLDLLEDHFYKQAGGELRSVNVFNGPKGLAFRASYKRPPQGAEMFQQMTIRGPGVGKPISWDSRPPMTGLYWPQYAEWLPEVLSHSKWIWKLEGFEEIKGARCARISGRPSDREESKGPERLWLDLEHDCLVRRYRSPGVMSPEQDFMVDKFQRLPNGLWFPKNCRVQLWAQSKLYENHLLEVTEAAVNTSLDLRRFEPPAPQKGTLIDDRGRVYTHGISRPQSQKRTPPKTVGSNAQSSPARSASPPTSGWLWWSGILLGVSFLFLVAGFWFWRK